MGEGEKTVVSVTLLQQGEESGNENPPLD